MSLGNWVLLANLAVGCYLLGLIWTVQVVHYPAFRFVSRPDFVSFAHFHQAAIGRIVAPPMVFEAFLSLLLIIYPPEHLPAWIPWSSGAMTGIIWIATFAVQVPLHRQLAMRLESGTVDRLIQTNWVRTAGWTLRCGLLLYGVVAVWEDSA